MSDNHEELRQDMQKIKDSHAPLLNEPRRVMRVLRAVPALLAEVAALRAERDGIDAAFARVSKANAESAAELVGLRQRVEALADEWYADRSNETPEGRGFAAASRLCADEIRAALAADSPEPEPDDDDWGHQHGSGIACPVAGCWAAQPQWERDPACVEQWPDCEEDAYNPQCCRWPKSCSCLRPVPSVAPEPEEQPVDAAED